MLFNPVLFLRVLHVVQRLAMFSTIRCLHYLTDKCNSTNYCHRSYADERRAEHARQLTNRLESVTQWYRDQFEVLDEELHKVRAQADDVGGGQQRAACKIEAVRCHTFYSLCGNSLSNVQVFAVIVR